MSALDKMFEGLPDTLTPERAAEVLGINSRTIRGMIAAEKDPLPALKLGNAWIILRDDFKPWLLRRSNYTAD